MTRTDAILPSVFCICAFSLLSKVGMTACGDGVGEAGRTVRQWAGQRRAGEEFTESEVEVRRIDCCAPVGR